MYWTHHEKTEGRESGYDWKTQKEKMDVEVKEKKNLFFIYLLYKSSFSQATVASAGYI